MIGRKDELEKIEEILKMKRSLLILGQKGIGKTTILRYIAENFNGCYVEHFSVKQALISLLNHFKLPTKRSPRYMTTKELFDLLDSFLKRDEVILLIDDIDTISKSSGKILGLLEDYGVVIVGASEKKVWKFRFRETLELKYLSREESKELAKKFLKKKSSDLVLDLVATKSMGVPGKIKEICKDYKIAFENFDVNPFDKKSIFDFFIDIRPHIPERIDIFPVWLLFVLGFGVLFVRNVMYSQGHFSDAYLIGAYGYLALITYRLVMVKRYKR